MLFGADAAGGSRCCGASQSPALPWRLRTRSPLALLFAAGFFELSFYAMAQTLVQVHAPPPLRGRVIGVFLMFSLGMRAFSGVTVGLGGSFMGVHWSLAASAGLVLVAILALRAAVR